MLKEETTDPGLLSGEASEGVAGHFTLLSECEE